MAQIQLITTILFILVILDGVQTRSTQNSENIQNENDLIYEAIKKYEDDALEKNKLTICSYAISKVMNDKSDLIKVRLESENGNQKEEILGKLYFSSIELCLNKLREEYIDSYISINFIDDVKWEDYLNIDLSNLKQYYQALTDNQIIIQKSIEKIIEAPILQKEILADLFGFQLKYQHLPYLAITFAFLLIIYAVYIGSYSILNGFIYKKAFKEFIFNPNKSVRQNAYGIRQSQMKKKA